MPAKKVLSFLVVPFVLAPVVCWSQAASSEGGYLMRIERQTREENVCMLLQKDGHFHLEPIITGWPRFI